MSVLHHKCTVLHTMRLKTRWWNFTVTTSWLKVTTVHWTSWIKVLGAFEIKRLPLSGPTAGREVVFLHKTIRWNESGFSYRPDPKHVIETSSLEDARLGATPLTFDTGKGEANTLCELSVTEKAIYMSGSGLWQYIAVDRMDVVFATEEVRSRTAKDDVPALLLLKRVSRYMVGPREVTRSSAPRQSITDPLLHGRRLGWRRDDTIVNDSWSTDERGPLA